MGLWLLLCGARLLRPRRIIVLSANLLKATVGELRSLLTELRMAKLSELVSETSEITGVPIATVREIGRRLREAGLIRTGKGGRYGGADMTSSDAASLLTALLLSRASFLFHSDIVAQTRLYLNDFKAYHVKRDFMGRWDHRISLPKLCELDRGHTFGDALIALIDFRNFLRDFRVEVGVVSPRPFPRAYIQFYTPRFGTIALDYLLPRDAQKQFSVDSPDLYPQVPFDLLVTSIISHDSLIALASRVDYV
jgi:DNA-binding transcriptional ArsR family regulator